MSAILAIFLTITAIIVAIIVAAFVFGVSPTRSAAEWWILTAVGIFAGAAMTWGVYWLSTL